MKKLISYLFIVLLSTGIQAKTKFIDLPGGNTSYQYEGEDNRPIVILIHGVSGPMNIWDKTFDHLVSNGLKVLRYDLYGRGQSQRLSKTYNKSLFLKQFTELIEKLKIKTQFHIIASSMGNIIASEYSLERPGKVKSITAIGPAGFDMKKGLLTKLGMTPVLGDALTCLLGQKVMNQRNKEYYYRPELFNSYLRDFDRQLKIKGSKKAILSTVRNMPVSDYADGYQNFGALGIPTLLIWGKQDISFSFSFSADYLQYVPHAEFLAVDKAAHLPHLEKANIVNPKILEFLKKHN